MAPDYSRPVRMDANDERWTYTLHWTGSGWVATEACTEKKRENRLDDFPLEDEPK